MAVEDEKESLEGNLLRNGHNYLLLVVTGMDFITG